MNSEFQNLSEAEIHLLYKAPLLVALLISGADNNIDHKEMHKAINTIKEDAHNQRNHVMELYSEIASDIEEKLNLMINEYPETAAERNPAISKELDSVSSILKKLNKAYAIVYYQTIRDLALAVAKSSGGFLGLNSVSKEEASWVELPMIHNPALMFDD